MYTVPVGGDVLDVQLCDVEVLEASERARADVHLDVAHQGDAGVLANADVAESERILCMDG